MEHKGLYRAAIYCRLSKDDGTDSDSTSISTQKMMLEKYCHEQGFGIHNVYCDDGYSGLNYNRPDFNRLLTDIDEGKVNLVVTKDLSRLGRDYIQTGYYTEIYFAKKKVRYIAVHDNIDTIRQDNDIAPFRNILNDLYAKDLSRKVKSAKRQRAYSGYYISAQTPYGYKVDPTDKNRLAVDEEAAEVVKEMYRLALSGCSTVQITKMLTAKQVPTPSAYKVRNGDTRFVNNVESSGETSWRNATVQGILRNMVYMGDMENHKYEVVNYKTKEYRKVPKDEHIIVQNTHEAIVSRENWRRVQELITMRHRPKKHDFVNVFKSIAFCSECGHRLTFAYRYNRKGEITFPYLRCMHRYRNSNACQNYHQIRYDDLYGEVLKRIKKLAKNVENGTLAKSVNKMLSRQRQADRQEAEKLKITNRLASLAKITKQLYEDNACGNLDADSYRTFLSDYQDEQKRISQRLQAINAELNKQNDYAENIQKLSEVVQGFMDVKELTANMLNQLVERVEVGHEVEIDGEKRQEISIVYRFVGGEV